MTQVGSTKGTFCQHEIFTLVRRDAQCQTQSLGVPKYSLNRKVCVWKKKDKSLGSVLKGTAKLLLSLYKE